MGVRIVRYTKQVKGKRLGRGMRPEPRRQRMNGHRGA